MSYELFRTVMKLVLPWLFNLQRDVTALQVAVDAGKLLPEGQFERIREELAEGTRGKVERLLALLDEADPDLAAFVRSGPEDLQ